MIRESVAVVPGLDGQKMSNLQQHDRTVRVSDGYAQGHHGIVTDSRPSRNEGSATCNVFALYKLFATEQERRPWPRITVPASGLREVKRALFDKFWTAFEPSDTGAKNCKRTGISRADSPARRGAGREELRKTLKAAAGPWVWNKNRHANSGRIQGQNWKCLRARWTSCSTSSKGRGGHL